VPVRFSAVETAEHYLTGPLSERIMPLARRFDTIWFGSDEAAKAQRMSLVAFAIRVGSAGLAFLSQVVMARWTGSHEYGIYVFVWTAVLMLSDFSCLGFSTVVIRFLPQYVKDGDIDRLRGLLLGSRLFSLLFSSVFAAIAIAAVWLLREQMEAYYRVPFILIFTSIPMVALGGVLEGAARAQSWPVRALAPTYIIRPLMVLGYMATAHALGYEANAITAVISAVLATYTTTILQLLVMTHDLDGMFPGGPRRTEYGVWIKYAVPVLLVESFFFLLTNADIMMVGIYLPPSDVAVYFATVKTLALVHFVFFAVRAGVAPQFASLAGAKDREALRSFARRSANWTFFPSLAMALAVLAGGHLLLSMFGAEFSEGYPLLFILVIGVVLRSGVGPAESLLNMTGHQNICAGIFGAALAINIALNLMLIPTYGLLGAAYASAIAIGTEALLLVLVVYRRVGVLMFVLAPQLKEPAA